MSKLEELKYFLHQKYESIEAFLNNIIFPIFGEDLFESAGNDNVLRRHPELQAKADACNIKKIISVGRILIEGSELEIFDITISSQRQLARSRVNIQEIVRRIIGTHSGAFMIFHYQTQEGNWDWRFTFCHKGASQIDSTDSKRYTFLLGPNQSCRTAAENFLKLHNKIEKDGELEMDDIIHAFDVEILSKEFFEKYKAHYEKFCNYLYENRNDDSKFGLFFSKCKDKEIRDYVKKLLGRLVFLQFLQKKGWLGVPDGKSWGEGDLDFLRSLFNQATPEQKSDFLDEILEPLFQKALDANRAAICQLFDTKVEGFRNCKIPYLNGGLFSNDGQTDNAKSVFPAEYFEQLLEFFAQYNFTIDENDPNDAEVGIDPEMLGRIFENLLEDNKDKGAFYTPKEIVQYMCRESLIAYLQTDVNDETFQNSIRSFVSHYDVESLTEGQKQNIIKKLKEVKICDPAIGSGAFPMGLLRELFACRSMLENFNDTSAAEIKKDIIQNSIYGVDIEKGAVDIARLRFWLTLILDEEGPEALPNLDFKIMQGNSLLERFQDVDLSNIAVGQQKVTNALKVNTRTLQGSILFQDEQEAMKEIQKCIRRYYNTDNHAAKQILYNKIENATRQYIIYLTEGRPKVQELVETLPLCNDQFFLWHTFFADVFEKGGFDIVIGNPPYIRHEKLDIEYKHLLCSVYPNVGEGTADILVYFFGLGINILSQKGILNYITSNKFLKTKYGKSLRNTLASEVDVLSFIDFFELPVFNNASTDAGITLLRKDNPTSETKYYPVLTLRNLDLDALTKGPYQHTIKTETEWQFINPQEQSILNKLNANAIPLTEFVNNRIYRGVTTGLNGTFMLSKEVRNTILSNCKTKDELQRTDNVMKKAFRSRDIRKYVYNGPQIWLLFIPWHFPLLFEETEKLIPEIALSLAEKKMQEEYPALYAYLCDNKEELSGRNKDETGKRYEWYALQRWGAKYYAEFDEEKLIYIHTAKNHEFYYDTEKHYVNNSCYIIACKSKFLYCFLNSKLFSYFKRIKFVAYGNGAEAGRCKLDGNKMATVPIKENVEESLFEEKFQKLQNLIKFQADTITEEDEIDRLIYQVYGLTEEEIAIVEGTTK